MNVARIRTAALLAILASPLFAQTRAPDGAPSPAAEPPSQKTTVNSGVVTVSSGPVGRTGAPPRRVISSEAVAALQAALPKPEPEPAKDEAPAAAAPVTPPEPEGPRNGILRLNPMVVQGDKALPVWREKDLLSRRDLAYVLVERYLSELDRGILNRWNLFSFSTNPGSLMGSKEGRAMQMYEDDMRRQSMDELATQAANAERAGDTEGSEYIKKISEDTFQRRIPWGYIRDRR